MVAMVKYFFASVWMGVEMFFDYAPLTAEGRKLAQDMRASMHGELRDQITVNTVHRLDNLCASIRRGDEKWEKANSIARFIIKPMRRNMVENCEMLEDVVARLKQAADAEPSDPEQDQPEASESGT